MATVTRRRSSRDSEPEEKRDERPTRRGRASESEESTERPTRGRRGRSSEDEAAEDKPSRGRRGPRSSSSDEDDAPRRRRGRGGEDEGGSSRRRGSRGFGSYSSKKVSSGDFANDFKPGHNNPTLIKFGEADCFDSYNQHWINDMPEGERKSYVCLDDEEYFGSTDCPFCEIGEKPKTFALFNIIDLSNPRKPEAKVWSASPAVADYLERASKEKKTSPIDREDLYFEVELQKKGKKYQWVLTPIKARDLPEDFDMEPLEEDEIKEFAKDFHDDRKAVTKIDTFEDLAELADDLMK